MESYRMEYNRQKTEHEIMMKADPYYRHCYGGCKVPEPCCFYCTNYDGGTGHPGYCMFEVNNFDITNVMNPEDHERDEADLCEHYEWNGEWEED